ncbi:MAG: phosphoglycerate dehydrogenase [Alphaproteobacteria bacterium]|nr:phosphoglycerate dehydrogenase [Alphaproteobacteria bacterium]
MVKVLIADDLSPRAADKFCEWGVLAEHKVGLKPEALIEAIGDYDGLAVRSATKVTPTVLEAGKRLKVVGRAGIGVDNIDVAAATQRGICVMNTPFGNSITTAEHTIAMLLAMARQIPLADRSTQAGKWEKNRFMGVELYGKTLGIVGCGNIGSIVADRAQGLKMKVLAFDPFLSEERARDLGVERVELDELFERADFITLHTPLTDQTRGLINAANIAKMKAGVRLINCARGDLVVEEDLRAALASGRVAAAAIDVFAVEPARQNVLFGLDNLVATPHLGAATAEAQENVAVQIAEQMAAFLLQGAVANAINMPSVTAEEAPKLSPYIRLARLLGSFAGQLTDTAVQAVHLEYEGHVAGLNTRPLTAVALEGLLHPLVDSVNMVNAPVIARERNIEVRDTRTDRAGDYQTLIRLTVRTERYTRDVAGTLFAGQHPRLVQVKGIKLEGELGRYMLYVTNQDRPGHIGRLGSLLGGAGINIASFHLGRASAGGDAIALIETDQLVSEDVLAKVRALPSVAQARALSF